MDLSGRYSETRSWHDEHATLIAYTFAHNGPELIAVIFYCEFTGNLRLVERKISTYEREYKPERDEYEEHHVNAHAREHLQTIKVGLTFFRETGHFHA